MGHCSISETVRLDGMAAVEVSPGATVLLPLWLDRPLDVKMMLRLPAPSRSGAALRVSVALDGHTEGLPAATNESITGDSWIAVGPFTAPEGRHQLALAGTSISGSSWPQDAGPVYLAGLTVGGRPVAPDAILAAQPAERQAIATTLGDAPTTYDYFTSFDETGVYDFLTYIPWIYNRLIVSGAPVQQSNLHALSGSYSCCFQDDMVGTSALETNDLPIPAGTATATLGGWVYIVDTRVQIDVHIVIDGTDNTRTWSFENDELGKWVERFATITLPAGAQTFYGWIKLRPNSNLSTNTFWLDNYGVDFAPLVELQVSYALFGDFGGTVYALSESATGDSPTPVWKKTLAGGMVLGPITVSNDVAYVVVTAVSATLYALGARDGRSIWQKALAATSGAGPVAYAQLVLAMTTDGWLRAYKVATGDLDWQLDAMGLGPSDAVSINGAVLDGDVLYVTTDSGVFAADLAGKHVLWTKPTPSPLPYPAAVGNGMVYAGSADGSFYAFNAATGNQDWTFPAGAPVNSEPQVIGNTVVFGTDGGALQVLDGATGARLSQLSFTGAVRCFCLASNMLFVISNAIDGAAYGYTLSISNNAWSWTKIWSRPLEDGAQADPVIDGDDVYVTASNGVVYSLKSSDGTVQWSYRPERGVMAPVGIAPRLPKPSDSLRFSDVCWLCSHNAYANSEDGWWYTQQLSSIPHQLDDGVRALMLDIWICDGTVVYAHGGCAESKALMMNEGTSFLPFATSLGQIKDWLDRNPNEIVTLIIEQRTGSKIQTQLAVTASGIGRYIFDPVTDWNVALEGWPTLTWMVTHGKRLVVFSDWGKFVNFMPDGDGFPYVWTWCVENDYGDASMDGKCAARAGSSAIDTGSIALFIQNYFLTVSVNWVEPHAGTIMWRRYDRLNDSELIMQFVQGCRGLRSRLPNFVAVDWYQNGYNGGPREAVARINTLRRQSP